MVSMMLAVAFLQPPTTKAEPAPTHELVWELVPVQSCSRRGCTTTYQYRQVMRPVSAPAKPAAKPEAVQPAPKPPAAKTETKTEIKEKKNKTVIKTRTTTAALDQLNRQRAQRGLRPYVFDEGLTRAAEKCASIRASRFIHGHLQGGMGDFGCLEPGVTASAAGAGALTPDWGFATCCMYEGWTHAGAAWVMGSDGRQYCSLFVR